MNESRLTLILALRHGSGKDRAKLRQIIRDLRAGREASKGIDSRILRAIANGRPGSFRSPPAR